MIATASLASAKTLLATRAATRILLVIVLATALATALASMRVASARSSALASERDLATCRDDLRDLDVWHATVRPANDPTAGDPELNRRIRAAATSAALLEQIASIEPGPAIRLRDSDVMRTPIYLRLDGVTLRQVVAFVSELTTSDASMKATGIEFSAPPTTANPVGGNELWTADVTLSVSTISPRGDQAP